MKCGCRRDSSTCPEPQDHEMQAMPTANPRDRGTLRILFAGGCHVLGYPLGEDASFPDVVKRRLRRYGTLAELHRLPYMKLTHAAKLQAACAACRPDVLVLQLGHFELSRPLSQYLRSLLRFDRAGAAKSGAEPPARLVRHAHIFRAKAGMKRAFDWVLGHPLVDFVRFEAQLNALLAQTQRWAPPAVVLLSPLPCADPLSMYYRRHAASIMQQSAHTYGLQFLNLISLLPDLSFGAEENYYDAIHLGGRGHNPIGEAVSECIAATLSLSDAQPALL